MDPSKQKKPSLSRLNTRTSSDRQSTIPLPTLAPKIPAEINLQHRPQSERQAAAPFLFPEENTDDENIAPMKECLPEAKPVYVTHKSIEEELSPNSTKVKAMYYEDAFAVRGSHNSPKERVAHDSVVIAELATHKAKEEDSRLVADLVSHLAQIYQRPESTLQVVLHQNVSIIFGSTSLPSYLLKIYALPSAIAPVTNIRNTGLIQKALEELLGIPPEQGILLFLPVPEENLATSGSTAQDAISRLERADANSPGLFKSISRGMSRRLKSNSDNSAPMSLSSTVVSPSSSTPTNLVHSPIAEFAPGEGETRGRRLKKRESLRSILQRQFRHRKESESNENA